MKKIIVFLIMAVFLTGCASGSRQYLRLVSMDVYDGLDTIKTDSEQAGKEANKRYAQADQMLRDVITRKVPLPQTQVDLEDTLKDLDVRKEKFVESTKLNSRVMVMSDEVKKGLGWTEGPRDPLPFVGAAATGAAIGLAF